jgi:hypothetical protein
MPALRRTLAAAMCLALVACGGKQGNGDTSPDAGGSAYALTLVGSAAMVLHPGEKRTLQVVFAQDQVGPVVSAAVHFEFQDGEAEGASLDVQDVKTDPNGVATVHFTAGSSAASRPTFKVVASAASYGASPVAFSFNIIPVRRLLQIVGTPTTHVSPDGESANVAVGISSSTGLKVRELDQDTGNPIAGDTISFTLPPAAKASWSGGKGNSASAQTGSGGEAQVFLLATQTPENIPLITAQSALGGAAVNFSVSIQAAGSSSCTSSQQCNPGQTCVGGHCQDGGGTGCDNGSDNPCPAGYQCISGVCQPPSGAACDPSAPNCASGQCCDPASTACKDICPTPCATGTHCQPGSTCGTGTCVNDNTGPDVSGVWLTKHAYSIREALPGTLQKIFEAIRIIDQALLGKLTIPGLPQFLQDWLNKLVSAILQQYLPDWLQQVIHIADDVVTVLSDLRSEGSMRLTRNLDLAHVKGTEVWTSLVFYWLPLCNGNIGGDPGVPPDCARIDLATTDSQNPGEVGQCKGQSLPSITVQARPFTASVVAKGANNTAPFVLNVDPRQVSIKMGKVILVLIDLIISYVTPYHCIDEITDCHAGPGNCPLIDCYGLGQDADNLISGIGGTVEAICDGVVTVAGQTVTQALAGAWPLNAELLAFGGHAAVSGAADVSACDAGSAGNCAGQLGNDSYDKDLHSGNGTTRANRDGAWDGDFFFKLVHKLPGSWEARRPQ